MDLLFDLRSDLTRLTKTLFFLLRNAGPRLGVPEKYSFWLKSRMDGYLQRNT